MAEPKKKYATIDEYIADLPEHAARMMQLFRQTIHEEAPDATEKISYGMPAFFLTRNLIYFGAWKEHIGVYPPFPDHFPLKHELAPLEGPKGAVHFSLDKPLPLPLIREMVRFRVQENLAKKKRSK